MKISDSTVYRSILIILSSPITKFGRYKEINMSVC